MITYLLVACVIFSCGWTFSPFPLPSSFGCDQGSSCHLAWLGGGGSPPGQGSSAKNSVPLLQYHGCVLLGTAETSVVERKVGKTHHPSRKKNSQHTFPNEESDMSRSKYLSLGGRQWFSGTAETELQRLAQRAEWQLTGEAHASQQSW